VNIPSRPKNATIERKTKILCIRSDSDIEYEAAANTHTETDTIGWNQMESESDGIGIEDGIRIEDGIEIRMESESRMELRFGWKPRNSESRAAPRKAISMVLAAIHKAMLQALQLASSFESLYPRQIAILLS
jgi:hypothetical protein